MTTTTDIEVIDRHPEQEFISWLKWADEHLRGATVAHFCFSRSNVRPTEETLIAAVDEALGGRRTTAYLFPDGDAVLAWESTKRAVYDEVCSAICRYYQLKNVHTDFHHHYDLKQNAEQLRMLGFQKMALRTADARPLPTRITLDPTNEQLDRFRRVATNRKKRTKPHILIVEDQTFSRKLLLTILEPTYKVHVAENAAQAFELHLREAPDIILLDIELPDMSGHDLAAIVRTLDSHVFIIMVSANHSVDDVTRARENGAKGFIAKPYSKQKILDAIKTFVPSWIIVRS